jgi:hypothetical protein
MELLNGKGGAKAPIIVHLTTLALESVTTQGRVGAQVLAIRGSGTGKPQDFPLHKECDIVVVLGGVTYRIEGAVITGMKLATTDKGEPIAEVYWGGGTYTNSQPQALVGT